MNTDIVKVFCAPAPFGDMDRMLVPESRNEAVEKVTNPGLARLKRSSWNLLSFAVKELFSKEMSQIRFCVSGDGKWTCDEFCFSLSHTDSLVSVALSSFECGVDIEKNEASRFSGSLAERILTHSEYQHYKTLENEASGNYAARLWTQKESIFKIHGKGAFCPRNIDTSLHFTKTVQITFDKSVFYLSVAADRNFSAEYHFLTSDIFINGE